MIDMADYCIFELDGGGRTYSSAEFAQFESDADALAQAIAKRRANSSEIWCGTRLLRRLPSPLRDSSKSQAG